MVQSININDVNIEKIEPLVSPGEVIADLPVTKAMADNVLNGRSQIKKVINGDDPRLLVIVGPCSIHDEKAGLEYAERLLKLSERLSDRMLVIMRVYFEKPRTTVGWKGLIYDPMLDGSFRIETGLRRARGFLVKLAEMGLPAATEFLDPVVPQYLADLVSWAAIGARTIESQTHRQMASGLSMPVGFKNSTDGNVQNAVDAIVAARAGHAFFGIDRDGNTCMVQTKGNPDTHVVLRGGSHGSNYMASSIALAQAQLKASGLPSTLMVDCSHGNSEKDHTKQALVFRDIVSQRMAGDANIIGCMVESHLFPGNQKLGNDPSKLEYGLSITDACIGWDETEALLIEAHDTMAGT
jgi:3-deoxy-7-phosphoheptulonate synthase